MEQDEQANGAELMHESDIRNSNANKKGKSEMEGMNEICAFA